MRRAVVTVLAMLAAGPAARPALARTASTCGAQKKACAEAAANAEGDCLALCPVASDVKACRKACRQAHHAGLQQCATSAGLCRHGAWRVTFEGSASYQETTTDTGNVSEDISGGIQWTTTFRDLLVDPFKRFRPPGDFPATAFASAVNATGSFTTTVNGGTPCTGAGGLTAMLGSLTAVNDNPVPVVTSTLHQDGSADVTVQSVGKVLESPLGAQDCSDINGPAVSDFWTDWVLGFGHAGLDNDGVTMTATLTLSKSDLAQGKVIVAVAAPAAEIPDTDCGSGNGVVCTQSYGWTGMVTFQRESTIAPGS